MIGRNGFRAACIAATLAAGACALAAGPREAGPSRESAKTPTSLKVGDPAPSLGLGAFFKGEPIQRLEKGRMYLVEFWATWCTPCKMLVPHLSRVAGTYRDKVTVLAVNVAEQGHEKEPYSANLGRMQRFMKGAAAGMDYSVAMDDDRRTMEKTWLAASSGGFPSAILVDRDGRIAWMGYPGETLPEVLDLALAGNLDGKAIQRLKAREQAIQKAEGAFSRKLESLLQRKRYHEALDQVEDRIARGEKAGQCMALQRMMRYQILTKVRPQEARPYGEAILRTYVNYPIFLTFFANQTAGEPFFGGKPGNTDGPLALEAAKLAFERNDSQNPLILLDLAKGYGMVKDYANAIHYTELAMASLKDYGREGQLEDFASELKAFHAKAKAAQHPDR